MFFVLAFLFLAVPFAELAVIVWVGSEVGIPETLLLLVAIWATTRHVPESRDEEASGRFDWAGSLVAIAAAAVLLVLTPMIRRLMGSVR